MKERKWKPTNMIDETVFALLTLGREYLSEAGRTNMFIGKMLHNRGSEHVRRAISWKGSSEPAFTDCIVSDEV